MELQGTVFLKKGMLPLCLGITSNSFVIGWWVGIMVAMQLVFSITPYLSISITITII